MVSWRSTAVLGVLVAGIILNAVGSRSAVANGDFPFRSYQGLVGTKVGTLAQPPALHQADVYGQYYLLERLVVSPSGEPVAGALSIDTGDTATWKAPVKTGPTAWALTTKAQSAASAGVYINGQFRPFAPGTKLIVKQLGSGLDTIYLKVSGMAPNGAGSTKVGVESETKTPGMDWQLRVSISEYPEGSVLSGPLSMGFGFSEPIDSINETGVVLECGTGPVPITVELLSMAIRVNAAAQPPGSLCTVTIAADAPTDADSNDPPDGLAEDFVLHFEVSKLTVFPYFTLTSFGLGGWFPLADGDVVPTSGGLGVSFEPGVKTDVGAITISGCSVAYESIPMGGLTLRVQFVQLEWVPGETCTLTVHKDRLRYIDENGRVYTLPADIVISATFIAPP